MFEGNIVSSPYEVIEDKATFSCLLHLHPSPCYPQRRGMQGDFEIRVGV